jgi:hypothetical protein
MELEVELEDRKKRRRRQTKRQQTAAAFRCRDEEYVENGYRRPHLWMH